jgi:hypothetical protein
MKRNLKNGTLVQLPKLPYINVLTHFAFEEYKRR